MRETMFASLATLLVGLRRRNLLNCDCHHVQVRVTECLFSEIEYYDFECETILKHTTTII